MIYLLIMPRLDCIWCFRLSIFDERTVSASFCSPNTGFSVVLLWGNEPHIHIFERTLHIICKTWKYWLVGWNTSYGFAMAYGWIDLLILYNTDFKRFHFLTEFKFIFIYLPLFIEKLTDLILISLLTDNLNWAL